jgi:hypothetical protein
LEQEQDREGRGEKRGRREENINKQNEGAKTEEIERENELTGN